MYSESVYNTQVKDLANFFLEKMNKSDSFDSLSDFRGSFSDGSILIKTKSIEKDKE